MSAAEGSAAGRADDGMWANRITTTGGEFGGAYRLVDLATFGGEHARSPLFGWVHMSHSGFRDER